jgi:hypothetical protein
MYVLDAMRKRRGQLEYGHTAMFSSRGPICLDPDARHLVKMKEEIDSPIS